MIVLIDARGRIVGEVEESDFPIRFSVKKYTGLQEYKIYLTFKRDEEGRADRSKIKSVNMGT